MFLRNSAMDANRKTPGTVRGGEIAAPVWVSFQLSFGGGEPMVVDGLLIPDLLEAMLAEGRWPRTADEASKQNLQSRVPEDRNRRLRSVAPRAPAAAELSRYRTVPAAIVPSCSAAYELVRTDVMNVRKRPRIR